MIKHHFNREQILAAVKWAYILKTRTVMFLWSTSPNNWRGKLDCVNANIFHHTQKKFEMITGPKLDCVNRPLQVLSASSAFLLHIFVGSLFTTTYLKHMSVVTFIILRGT